MDDLLHRTLHSPPVARRGEGSYVTTDRINARGTRDVFDLSSGAGVACLGHSNARVKAAMLEQIVNAPYVHSAQFTTPAADSAGTIILDNLMLDPEECVTLEQPGEEGEPEYAPFDGGGVTFFSGGSEAIEAAIKIALQSHHSNGKRPAMIFGRQHSYHGQSIFTLALGDHPRKRSLQSWDGGVDMESSIDRFDAYAPDLFANPLSDDERKHLIAASLASLEVQLQNAEKRQRPSIVIIEPIGGTTLGIAPPDLAYLIGVRGLCDRFGSILIYDEILSANFRTGCFSAWQYYQQMTPHNITPDIVVLGKGITGGYFPMSAVVVNRTIRGHLAEMGTVWHTSTNQNHPIGCAAVAAAMTEYGLITGRIRWLGKKMEQTITPFLTENGFRCSGVGTIWGLHFRVTEPLLHKKAKQLLMDEFDITAYVDGGTVNGRGNMILFAPPYSTSELQLSEAAGALADMLKRL